jgi:UDP:flavonoid glycosyltransferase YjiC (YdhE family)
MHITIVTAGSQGDIQPMLALAVGLQQAGFEIRFCAHSHFQSFVERHRVPFFPIWTNSPVQVQRDEHGRKRKSRIATLLHVLKRRNDFSPAELNQLAEACRSTDAVVLAPLAGTVYHVVEQLRLPCCVAWLHPQFPTRFIPSLVGLPMLPLGPAYNIFTHIFMQAIFWLPTRSWTNRWRTGTLGLEPISLLGPLHRMRQQRIPMLFGFSSELVARPKDWPEWMHVTGFWFLEPISESAPPEGLADFIDAGPAPISIGFGSVVDPAADTLLQNILEALAATGQRAVLVSGWNRYTSSLPKHVFQVSSASYDWLFPRMSAAMHAGGAGTVAEALRAGIPSICVPFAGEQKYYAKRLAALGVAPAPIHRQDVTVPGLIRAITAATTSAAMRQKAQAYGCVIRHENGVGEAVRLLRHYLPGAKSNQGDEVTISGKSVC